MARSSTSFRVGSPGPALRHGARSRITLETRAAEVREELTGVLTEHLPHLSPADRPLVELAVEVSTKLRLLHEFLDRTSGGSLIDGRGRPRSCASLCLTLMRQSVIIFDRLGIGPVARGQLLGSLGLAGDSRTRIVEEAQKRLRARVEADEAAESNGKEPNGKEAAAS